jgi:hypothetical protein
MRMTGLAIALTLLTLGANPDAEAASIDRAKLGADGHYAYYLSLSSQRSPEAKERLAKVVRSTLPALSSKSYLGDQLPVRVSDDLLRIDTRGLGWEKTLPQVLAGFYPYRPDLKARGLYPYTFRADWFVACVTDGIQTGDSQFRLTYGVNAPKTTTEFRKFWKANEDPNFLFQFHEAQSGVGVNPDRNVLQFDTATRGSLWATQDSENPVGDKDPGNYGKPLKFDAGEEFAMAPVQYNGEMGLKMIPWLANGKGERQVFAPARIVTDHNQVRSSEIRLNSCRVCHIEGLRPLNVNGFKRYIEQGSRVAADKKTQQLIDQQYQAGVEQQLEADNRLYAKYLEMTSGYTPAQDSKAFEQVIRTYDAPVTREQAAREVYMTDEEFRLALGYYSAKYSLSRRLADLSQGGSITRQQWVNEYALAQVVKAKWEQSK